MKLKTAKGNIQLLAEGDGVVLFQKQVSGEEWIQDIINDDVIGGLYYNSANKDYMPDGLGTDSPFYYKIIKNTNGTFEGFEVIPYNHTFLYVNSSAGSFYKVGTKGLNKISLSKNREATSADKAKEAGHAAEADYATQALLAGNALRMVVNSGTEETPNYTNISLGNANMPVYFSNGIPIACDYRVVKRIDTTSVGQLEIADGKGSSSSKFFWEWTRTKPSFQSGENAGYYYTFNNNDSSSKTKIRMNAIYVELGKFIVATAEIKLASDVTVDDLVLCWPAKDHIDDELDCDCSPISMQVSPLLNSYEGESSILCAHVAGSSDKNCYVIADTNGTFGGCYVTVFAVKN